MMKVSDLKSTYRFVSFNVHWHSIDATFAALQTGREKIRFHGTIGGDCSSLQKVLDKMQISGAASGTFLKQDP